MLLNYQMDISGQSRWRILTPNSNLQGLPFTVTESGHFYAGADFFTERDSKAQYYFIYTVSGCGLLQYAGQEAQLPPGTAALIYCDSYHCYRTASAEPWEHKWVHFTGSSAFVFDSLINEGGLNPVTVRNRMEFEEQLDGILRISGVLDIEKSVRLSLYTNTLLSMLVADRQQHGQNVRSRGDVRTAAAYIHAHYREPLSLEDITRQIHISKYYFVKLFKQETGMTPYEYLLNYRINKAKELLRTAEAPINQIAGAVGFSSQNNFIKQFKAITGVTPLTYRRTWW